MGDPANRVTARVRIWIARPEAIDDPALLERYGSILSPDEDARLGRRQVAVARQFLVTRVLARWALSQVAEVDPTAWEFEDGEHGKPYIVGPVHAPELSFNLSHSGEIVACAVATGVRVGLDVENLERERSFEEVAGRFFAPGEAAAVRARTGAEQRERFYEHWTLKEAYIKARGLGIALPLSAFWFDLEHSASPRISFDERIDDDPRAWQFWQQCVDDRHLAALAVDCGEDTDLDVDVCEVTPFAGG